MIISPQVEIPSLRHYQSMSLANIRSAMTRHRAIILEAPPGSGKTRLAKSIMARAATKEVRDGQSGRSVFAVHRRSLVDNASESFSESPELPHGLIMSGCETSWQHRVQVASIDTLLAWYCEDGYTSDVTFDFIVFDECVSGDAIVETELGKMRIDEVPELEPRLVKSFDNESGKVLMKRILDWKYKGQKDTIVVHTSTGKFRCTDDHKVFTERGWLPAKELSESDRILVCVGVEESQEAGAGVALGTSHKSQNRNMLRRGSGSKRKPQIANVGVAARCQQFPLALNLGSNLGVHLGSGTIAMDTSSAPQTNHLSLAWKSAKQFWERYLVTAPLFTLMQDLKTQDSRALTGIRKNNGRNIKQKSYTGSGQKLEYARTMDTANGQCAQTLPVCRASRKYTSSRDPIEAINESQKSGLTQSVTSGLRGGSLTMELVVAKTCSCTPKDSQKRKTSSSQNGSATTSEKQQSSEISSTTSSELQAGRKLSSPTSSDRTRQRTCSTNWSQVERIETGRLEAVYDIEVEETHCFFANEHLVHNCHSHANSLTKFLRPHDIKRKELGLKPAFVLGLSATPEAKELPKIFGEIVHGPKTEWLIEQGYLSTFRYFQATQGDMSKLKKQAGEFTAASVVDAMKGLSGDLIRDWKRYGNGRPTVGFFRRIDESIEARDLLRSEGVRSEHVDGNTSDDDRKRLFRQLGDGSIDYLCNVGVVERGTNIPEVSCVQLCLPIGSKKRFNQMVGRGSRTAEGKDHCVVIDHGGNITRHGFFEDDVEWVLDNSTSVDKDHEAKPSIKCPSCDVSYRGGKCSACGYEPTPAEFKSQGLEFDGGEMKEINRSKDKAEPKKKTCEEIMISALYMAGRSGRTWKQAMGIAYGIAKKQGTKMRVPKTVTVGGKTYNMLPYGHPDSNRRVKHIYDFV